MNVVLTKPFKGTIQNGGYITYLKELIMKKGYIFSDAN